MARQYDLVIVVGAGTAAMGVATRVRAAGWSVAVVDLRPFGGTCALRGFGPKKLLISNGMDAPTPNGINVPKWKCLATT